MIRLLTLWLLGTLVGCRNTATIDPNNALTVNAVLYGNSLPADGCEAHLWLVLNSPSSDSRTFERLPTDATRAVLEQAVRAEQLKQPQGTLWMGQKDVTIRYRETDQVSPLLCGWNNNRELRAIELLEIRDR